MAQPETLTPAEMRGAAALSLDTGQPEQALALAEALLMRNEGDVLALVIQARALRDLGREDEAVAAAREAWRAASTQDERYAAAMVTAQALSSRGNRTMAQIWLRVAVETAPDEARKQRAIRDFRYVRARNPWETQLAFSIAPSDNINDGSIRDEISFAGLDGVVLTGAARALSGLEISGGVATRYTLTESQTHRTRAGVSFYYETYVLSDEARDIAPDVEGSDFAYGSVALTFGHEWRPSGWSGPLDLNAVAAWSWYGGERYGRTLEVSAARTFALGQRNRLRLGFALDQFALEPNEDAEDRAFSTELEVQWLRLLRGGALFAVAASMRDSESDNAQLDYARSRLSLSYSPGEPILGARATFGLEFEQRDFDTYPFEADGRHDDTAKLSVDLVFRDLDYYGFVPTVSLSRSDTASTSDRFDKAETGLNLGFRSAF